VTQTDDTTGTGPEVEDVLEALRDVVDPELGINVVDLGLVYGVSIDADRVATLDMTLTTAACPLTDVIEDQTQVALDGLTIIRFQESHGEGLDIKRRKGELTFAREAHQIPVNKQEVETGWVGDEDGWSGELL